MEAKQADFPFVNFTVSREYLDGNGLYNPRDGEPPLEGAFQVNVYGNREHYLRLAEFFRKFAELDTSDDGDHHEHLERIRCADGNVQLNVILRKDDVGDSDWWDVYAPGARPKQT